MICPRYNQIPKILLAASFAIFVQRSEGQQREVVPKGAKWLKKVIKAYIDTTNNAMIANLGPMSTWEMDEMVHTDTATYYVATVGMIAAKPNGSDAGYHVEQWLYIDSATRKLYEFDMANNRLGRPEYR